ncbi:hypothetical protein [Streptomyces sp. NPDC056975]|uniref:hypothetical protein n=1 Tax=unclassified Streptomyces TaxID=2593676 RepID=UPI0036439E38
MIGVRDPGWGERLYAVVVLRPGAQARTAPGRLHKPLPWGDASQRRWGTIVPCARANALPAHHVDLRVAGPTVPALRSQEHGAKYPARVSSDRRVSQTRAMT